MLDRPRNAPWGPQRVLLNQALTPPANGPPAGDVDVVASTGGITYQHPGEDFTTTRGTLSFGAGQTKASFRVPIVNDKRREDPESFLVRLHHPSQGAIQGTPLSLAVQD